MTRIPMNNLGTGGIVKDLEVQVVPLNAWTEGRNIRFDNSNAIKFLGDRTVFGRPHVPPYWIMPVQTGSGTLWIYAGLSKVYAVDEGAHSNITRVKTSPAFTPPPRELVISTTAPTVVAT